MSFFGKKEETPPVRPVATPQPPVSYTPPTPSTPVPEVKKESIAVSTTPFRSPETDRNYIGKAIRIVGQIFAKEDLYVDGDLEGTIESQDTKVTIGANGRVQANVKAREVVILGQIQGDVEASDKVDLKKDAKLIGNIATSRISIEDGAVFKGSIDIRKAEPKPTAAPASAPAPAPTPAPAVSTASPAPAAAAVGAAGAVRR